MLRIEGAERAEKMCQDEWLNESVIPSANEKATACVTRRLRGVRTTTFCNILQNFIMPSAGV